jgi:hypothetical protein
VAQLGPIPRRRWVPKQEVLDLLAKDMADPDFFDDVAELNEPLERLDEPWEPRSSWRDDSRGRGSWTCRSQPPP